MIHVWRYVLQRPTLGKLLRCPTFWLIYITAFGDCCLWPPLHLEIAEFCLEGRYAWEDERRTCSCKCVLILFLFPSTFSHSYLHIPQQHVSSPNDPVLSPQPKPDRISRSIVFFLFKYPFFLKKWRRSRRNVNCYTDPITVYHEFPPWKKCPLSFAAVI